MKRLTPWYPGDVKPLSDPEHVGEYQRHYPRTYLAGRKQLHWWDGKAWKHWKRGPTCLLQNLPWRGLAEKPE